MKCKVCGEKAVIKLRQHNLALCEEHFIERFRREVERTIKKYEMFDHGQPVLVAVSGGKDSLSLLHVLKSLDYEVTGLFIDLGIEGMSEKARAKVEELAARLDVELVVVSLKDKYGESLPEIAKRRPQHRICSLCGMIKRYLMNKTAYDLGIKVVATGHNLDDEVSSLLSNTLRWDVSYLAKQSPYLPSVHPKLAARAKPLAFLTEREIAAYAILSEIDFHRETCPFSRGAKTLLYKHLLNEIEVRSPGTKLRFYREFQSFRKRYLRDIDTGMPPLRECKICGMPTSLEVCAFCRLFQRDN